VSQSLSYSLVFPRSGQKRSVHLPSELAESKGSRALEAPDKANGREQECATSHSDATTAVAARRPA
jgi:hypothetical protein